MPSFTSIFTLLAASASALAYTTPTTFNSSIDAIFTPTLGAVLPVGKAFNITWKPDTAGTVTLVLLRGPASNILPLYSIAEAIKNTGTFEWTPKDDLEPDTTHYGLQLIEDSNGEFQYSDQFGISNPDYKPSSSSTTGTATGTATITVSGYASASVSTSTSTSTVYHTTHSSVISLVTITTSAAPYSNTTVTTHGLTVGTPIPSTTAAVTTSSSGNSTSLPTPTPTGAANGLRVAGSLLVIVAGAAVFLL